MSLDQPKKGNPAWVKGVAQNPAGKPKGPNKKNQVSIKDRLKGKWHTHPADRLVELAKYLEANAKFEAAANIWLTLLKYYEPVPKKGTGFDALPTKEIDEESLINELENNDSSTTTSSETSGVEKGQAVLPPETGPKENL